MQKMITPRLLITNFILILISSTLGLEFSMSQTLPIVLCDIGKFTKPTSKKEKRGQIRLSRGLRNDDIYYYLKSRDPKYNYPKAKYEDFEYIYKCAEHKDKETSKHIKLKKQGAEYKKYRDIIISLSKKNTAFRQIAYINYDEVIFKGKINDCILYIGKPVDNIKEAIVTGNFAIDFNNLVNQANSFFQIGIYVK